MAYTQAQKDALTEFSKTQPALKPRGQLGHGEADIDLGADLASGKVLDDDFRDKIIEIPFVLPAPTGAPATIDVMAWKAPFAGRIVSAEVIVNGTWSAGNNVGDDYLLAVRRHNNTPANLSKDHDFVTGLAAFTSAKLPTGASLALLTVGQTIAVAASGASATFTNAVDYVNQPAVGDYVSITSVATVAAGATPSNPGIYQVTAVTSTKVFVATKLFGHAPENKGATNAGAGDVSDMRLIRALESSFAAGDMLGLRAIVPISTTTPVDVSALLMTFVIRVRPA